ncbi:hypothetical protein Tco_0173243 [Tanacetum coccineum]
MNSENENDKVNIPSSPSLEPTTGYIDDLDFFKDFENEFPSIAYNDDIKSKSDPLIEHSGSEAPLAQIPGKGYGEDIVYSYEQRLETIWGRSVNQVYVLDFTSLTEGVRQTLGDRLSMVYTGDEGQELFTSNAWRRLFEIRAPLVRELILESLSTCRMSDTEMGLDVADTLCFQLGAHFGLVSDPRLRGLSVVTSELHLIDLHKLGMINICLRVGDTWAWIASGPERQSDVAAGALGVTKDAPAVDEGAQADPAPVQTPQPPPPAPRTIQQMVSRLEEEVHELRQSIVRPRGDIARSITDQSRFATWMVSCMTKLMDASGRTYQAFDNTLVGSSQLPYQRCTRRRTDDASTSAP